jgi:hypothetical protein
MACQVLNMTFLTEALVTTPEYAFPSKLFAEALHAVLPNRAMAEFLGSQRDFYRTRGIEMFQRLTQIHEPRHAGAMTSILQQLSNFSMTPDERPVDYKLRLELLHSRLSEELRFSQGLLAYTAYKGLDPLRFKLFKDNVKAGNKSVETVSSLFMELETFEHMDHSSTPTPPSARTVAVEKVNETPTPPDKPSDTKQIYDWKGQNGLNGRQVSSLRNRFKKGCLACRTDDHLLEVCPHLKNHYNITPKLNVGTARAVDGSPVPPSPATTAETDAEIQGKSQNIVNSISPANNLLLHSATSEQILTPFVVSTQDDILGEDVGDEDSVQWGSFQHEDVSGPTDPSLSNAIRFRRDSAVTIVFFALLDRHRTTLVSQVVHVWAEPAKSPQNKQ